MQQSPSFEFITPRIWFYCRKLAMWNSQFEKYHRLNWHIRTKRPTIFPLAVYNWIKALKYINHRLFVLVCPRKLDRTRKLDGTDEGNKIVSTVSTFEVCNCTVKQPTDFIHWLTYAPRIVYTSRKKTCSGLFGDEKTTYCVGRWEENEEKSLSQNLVLGSTI